jgi:hemolysin activation/secretion protein
VEGATAYSAAELEPFYLRMIGLKVTHEEMAGVASEMSDKYQADGYTNSYVMMPPQSVDAEKAAVRLVAVEGYISDIEWTGDPELAAKTAESFREQEAALLAMRPFRQEQFQNIIAFFSRLHGVGTDISLSSPLETGASVLTFEITKTD